MGEARNPKSSDRIPGILIRLFLAGLALVLVSIVGDILLLICKWTGFALMIYVLAGVIFRFAFEAWPEWIVRPCQKIQAWIE